MELFSLLGKIAIDAGDSVGVLDKIADKAQSVQKGLVSFGEKVQSVGSKVSSAGTKMTLGVTTPLMFLGKAAVSTAANFESAMSEVAAISGATGDDFKALENKAKEMGEKTKFSASEAAEGLKYMAMAGWKTSDMLNGLDGIMNLAAASGEDLGTTSDIVTDALTAFGLSASDSGHFADILATASSNANTNVSMMGETFKYVAPIAGAMGYSAEDTALAIGLMANSGIKASQAGTSLRSIMTRLANPTKDSAAAMSALGISVTDGSGKMKSLEEILIDMRNGFSGLTEEEKASYAAMLAGQEAMSGLLAIVNASGTDFEKLVSAIGSADGAAGKMAATMNDNLSGQITLLKSQLEALAIQFVTLIMPYLRQGVEWLQKLCTWISGLDDHTKKMILTVAGIAATLGPVLIVGGKIITGAGKIISCISGIIGVTGKVVPVIGSVVSGGGKVVTGIGSLVGKIGGALIPAIAAIPAPVWIVIAVLAALVAAGVAVYKNWDEIKAWASNVWGSVKETVGNAVDAIKGFFQGIGEKFSEMKENVTAKAHELKENVSQKFSELKENVIAKAVEIKDGAVEKFHELKENASEKISELKEKIASKFEEIKSNAAEKISELKENVVSKVEEMKENATVKVHEMGEKISFGFQEMKDKAAEKFNDLKERWTSKFTETKEKMISEAEEMRQKVGDKLEQFKASATEKIESFKTAAVQKFEEMKSRAGEKIGELSRKGVEGFNTIKEKGSSAISSLKDFMVVKFTEMGSAAGSKFSAIAENVMGIFSRAKDGLAHIVETVKGFFNFEWKLPSIKLPHFNISGGFSLNPPSIPSIGVEWYAKGGVMTEPTAFGLNPYSGNVMVGGAAGAEAIAPIETLKAYIREAVSDNNMQLYGILNAILMLLNKYLPELTEKQILLNTGVLVGELSEPIYDEFGRISHNRGRRN